MASTVGLIVSSAPMFTALLLWLCRRTTRPGASFFVGFVLAMAGIALISLAEGESFDFNPIGCLLALGSAISWGVYGLCLESAQRQGLNDLLVTRKVFFWGVLFTLPFCLGTGITFDLTRFAQPVMLGNTVYLGVVASALCFLAWNKASALIGPVATNVYLYLMPVITVAAFFLILGEGTVALPAPFHHPCHLMKKGPAAAAAGPSVLCQLNILLSTIRLTWSPSKKKRMAAPQPSGSAQYHR